MPTSPASAAGAKPTPAIARIGSHAPFWRYKISAHLKSLQLNLLWFQIPKISSPMRYKISANSNSLWSLDLSPRPWGHRYKMTSFIMPPN